MNKVQVIQGLQVVGVDLFERFTEFLDVSDKTVSTYGTALRQLSQYLSANGIRQPERADIIAFREGLKAQGLKPTTMLSYPRKSNRRSDTISPLELASYKNAITEAMLKGTARNVTSETDPSMNAKNTQGV